MFHVIQHGKTHGNHHRNLGKTKKLKKWTTQMVSVHRRVCHARCAALNTDVPVSCRHRKFPAPSTLAGHWPVTVIFTLRQSSSVYYYRLPRSPDLPRRLTTRRRTITSLDMTSLKNCIQSTIVRFAGRSSSRVRTHHGAADASLHMNELTPS